MENAQVLIIWIQFDENFIPRLVLVSGLKWVDEVIANAPYEITEEFMNRLFNEHKIDYIIHGDDPCLLPDGTDAYALAKKAGRYKQIKRTEGVSSTDIVGTITLLFYIHVFILYLYSVKKNLKDGIFFLILPPILYVKFDLSPLFS